MNPFLGRREKQSNIALSTSKAEYDATAEASKGVKSLKSLLHEIIDQKICIEIFNDNQSAQVWTNEQISYNKTKHTDTKYHFVRKIVSFSIIKLRYINTKQMIADELTKPLVANKHMKFIKALGLIKK